MVGCPSAACEVPVGCLCDSNGDFCTIACRAFCALSFCGRCPPRPVRSLRAARAVPERGRRNSCELSVRFLARIWPGSGQILARSWPESGQTWAGGEGHRASFWPDLAHSMDKSIYWVYQLPIWNCPVTQMNPFSGRTWIHLRVKNGSIFGSKMDPFSGPKWIHFRVRNGSIFGSKMDPFSGQNESIFGPKWIHFRSENGFGLIQYGLC